MAIDNPVGNAQQDGGQQNPDRRTVTLRFYGRFAYAQAFKHNDKGKLEPTGVVSVIAPTFDDTRFGKHHVLMSVRRDQVRLRRSETGIPPTRRLVTDRKDILEAELFAWDLEGCNVSIDTGIAKPNATFKGANSDGEILDLGTLEQFAKREAHLDGHALTASSGGKANAVIRVTAGDGAAHRVSTDDRGHLITQLLALTGNDGPVVGPKGREASKPSAETEFKLLDLVEFTIPLSADTTTLTFRIRDVRGRDGIVTVFAGSDNEPGDDGPTRDVVVSFSHLCSSLPMPVPFDFEYSQYYSLLQQNPGDQALILKPSQSAGEGGDCGYKAQLRYDIATGALLKD